MTVQVFQKKSDLDSSPNRCGDPTEDPRLASLGVGWHVHNELVSVQNLAPGKEAEKSRDLTVGDVLLKIDDMQAAATVAEVHAQMGSVLARKPIVCSPLLSYRSLRAATLSVAFCCAKVKGVYEWVNVECAYLSVQHVTGDVACSARGTFFIRSKCDICNT